MHEYIGPPARVVDAVYGSETPSYLMGGFAPSVARAAGEGDPVALRIWDDAGRLLARAALAASAALDPVYSWAGRLFDAGELVLAPFQETIRAVHPDAVFAPPAGSSTDGALLLASEHLSSPRSYASAFVAVYEMVTG
jgi:N-acetylglucosamine kinase-like BadF-type ATPase